MSANDLVTVPKSVMDQTVIMAYAGVGAIIFVIILVIFMAYTRYKTPKESYDIKKASNRGLLSILLVGLDHFADIIPVKDFIPEGVKESFPSGRGAKKSTWRFVLPKARSAPEEIVVDEADGKKQEATLKVIQALNNLNTEKVFLRKAKIPLLVGVKNSVAAVSLKFLGVQAFLNKLERIQKDGKLYPQIQALKESKNFKEIGAWLEDLSLGVSVIDFQQVYAKAAATVDQTTLDGISERDQTVGRREGKEDKDKQTKTVLLLIFGIIGLIIAGGIVIKVI